MPKFPLGFKPVTKDYKKAGWPRYKNIGGKRFSFIRATATKSEARRTANYQKSTYGNIISVRTIHNRMNRTYPYAVYDRNVSKKRR